MVALGQSAGGHLVTTSMLLDALQQQSNEVRWFHFGTLVRVCCCWLIFCACVAYNLCLGGGGILRF